MPRRKVADKLCDIKLELAASIHAVDQQIQSLAYPGADAIEHSAPPGDARQRQAELEAAIKLKEALLTDYRRHLRLHSCD